MEPLTGKNIVITGGTKGIGRGIAVEVGKQGANVVIGGRDETAGNEVIQELKYNGAQGIFVQGDLKKVDNCRMLVEESIKKYGSVDGLVNNAAIDPRASLLETDEYIFDNVFSVNIKGTFFCTKYAIKKMINNGGGTIVNIGSTHGFGGSIDLAAYSCSKGAIYTLTKHISRNYAEKNISANWITVGWVATPGEFARGKSINELKEMGKKYIPMGRLQTVEEIASGTIYLLSEPQITGSTLHITGGFVPQRGSS